MPANLQEALPFILLALALLVVLWVIFRASRTTKVIGEQEGDVLDKGVGPASRNQALIDTPPSATSEDGLSPETGTVVQVRPESAPVPAPVPEPITTPATVPTSTPIADTHGDDLKRIKGLGPKLVAVLAEQGITSFAQIAAWDDKDVKRVDASLGRFQGRITRDQWVEQARLLAAGDEGDFSKIFGNNG